MVKFSAWGREPGFHGSCAEQLPINKGLQYALGNAKLLHQSRIEAVPEVIGKLLALTIKLRCVFGLRNPGIADGGHRRLAHHKEVQGAETKHCKHGDNGSDNQPPKYPPGVLPHGLQHALPRSHPK